MVLASWGEVVGMGDLLQVLGNWGPAFKASWSYLLWFGLMPDVSLNV